MMLILAILFLLCSGLVAGVRNSVGLESGDGLNKIASGTNIGDPELKSILVRPILLKALIYDEK